MLVSTDPIFKKAYYSKEKERLSKKKRYPERLKKALEKSIKRAKLKNK